MIHYSRCASVVRVVNPSRLATEPAQVSERVQELEQVQALGQAQVLGQVWVVQASEPVWEVAVERQVRIWGSVPDRE